MCLPSSDLPAGMYCWVTGWDALEDNGSNPATLQQAKIPLIIKQRCGYVYGSLKSMLCAGYLSEKIYSCQRTVDAIGM